MASWAHASMILQKASRLGSSVFARLTSVTNRNTNSPRNLKASVGIGRIYAIHATHPDNSYSFSYIINGIQPFIGTHNKDLYITSRHVASLRAGFTLMIYWAGRHGYVSDNGVSSCRHLKQNSCRMPRWPCPRRYTNLLCGVAIGQPSTNDGPTCNTR